MKGLVHSHPCTARQGQLREQSPPLFGDGLAGNVFLCHGFDEDFDVITQKVELHLAVSSIFSGVNCQLRGWKGEDEPPMSYVYMVKLEYVAKEYLVGFGV